MAADIQKGLHPARVIAGQQRMGAKALGVPGVGEKTAIDFPGESSGLVRPWQEWDPQTNYATMFGQGLTTTALQVASIYQTIGNHGVKLPLSLVSGCKAADGTVFNSVTRSRAGNVGNDAVQQRLVGREDVNQRVLGQELRVVQRGPLGPQQASPHVGATRRFQKSRSRVERNG